MPALVTSTAPATGADEGAWTPPSLSTTPASTQPGSATCSVMGLTCSSEVLVTVTAHEPVASVLAGTVQVLPSRVLVIVGSESRTWVGPAGVPSALVTFSVNMTGSFNLSTRLPG